MPKKLEKAKFRPLKRLVLNLAFILLYKFFFFFSGILWWNESLQAYCLPFLGADKSVVQRSQYYDSTVEGAYPVCNLFYFLFYF